MVQLWFGIRVKHLPVWVFIHHEWFYSQFQFDPTFPLNVHLKAKRWHPTLHFRLQGKLFWHKHIVSLKYGALVNDLFFLAKACSPFRWKNPVDHSVLKSNQILFGAPWIDSHSCILHHRVRSPTNWLPSVVHASSTIESGAPRIDCLVLFVRPPPSSPEPHELIVIHASSTIESGALQIDCLVLFVYPPPSNLIRSPMNWLSFMRPPPSSLEPREVIA